MFLTYVALTSILTTPPSLLSVTIRDSLEASIVRSRAADGPAVSAEVARLLRWRGDVNKEVHRGDTLDVLVGEGQSEPELLALQFNGAQIKLRAYRFIGSDGIARYYDERGNLVEPQLINAPVPAYEQITETVQHGRGRRHHNGIDLKAPEGSPIRLPFAGRVVRTNWAVRVNGHCIEVAYQNGNLARFLHLSRIDPSVRPGAQLQAGAPLGLVGSTGHSNAPHLHYEIRQAGDRPVEPLTVHGRRAVRLETASLEAFGLQRDAYDRALRGPEVVAPLELSQSVQDCVPFSEDVQRPLGCRAVVP